MDQTLISTFIASNDSEDLKDAICKISLTITAGQASLLDLVEKLGEYLTRDDSLLRSKATSCLANVLADLPSNTLSKQQVEVISGFLCERLYDEESLPEVLLGLNAAIAMDNFSPSSLGNIVGSLQSNITMKKHPQNTRYLVLKLLDSIYNSFKPTIVSFLSETYLKAFIALVNGEKDPRNLLISFKLGKQLVTDLALQLNKSKTLVDELFDVTFCYFPITFEPPKNDPYGISAQDLRLALRDTLSANGVFARYTIPGLIEKLTSTVHSVKEDVLITLAASIEKYDPEIVKEHWLEIWDGIKYEVLHGTDEETGENAGIVLQKLGTSLSKCIDQSLLDSYLDSAQTETKGKLEDAQSKLSMPAAILLADISKSSDKAYEQLSRFSLSVLLLGYTKSPSIGKQKAILEIIVKFLEAAVVVDEEFNDAGQRALERFKDDIMGVFSRSLMGSEPSEVALRLTALKGLTHLITNLPGYLTESEIGLVSQYFDTIILEDSQDEICQAALAAQLGVSKYKPDFLATVTFPALLAALPANDGSNGATSSGIKPKSLEYVLHSLAYLTESRSTLEMLSVRLFNKLDDGVDVHYSLALLSALLSLLVKFDEQSGDNKSPLLVGYLFKFMPRLVSKIYDENTRKVFASNAVINVIGSMLSVLCRNAPDHEQTDFTVELLNLFYYENEKSKLVKVDFVPYLSSGNRAPTNIVNIFVMGLAPVSKDEPAVLKEANKLLSNAISIVSKSRDGYERLGYLRLIGLICNKWISSLAAVQEAATLIGSKAISDIEILAWISKGLINKNDTAGFKLLEDVVLSHLKEEGSVGVGAGKVLGVVPADDSVLSKENGLTIRLLYRQRLFFGILPKLVEGFKESKNCKINYMIALAGLLRFTPSKIVSSRLAEFLPLLLESLDMQDAAVLKAAIDTIIVTLKDNSDVFKEHMNLLTPQLIKVAITHENDKVRIGALNALALFPVTFDIQYLQPYRATIIRDLGEAVDDRKREVRKAAVVCRQAFYELGMVEE